MSFGVKLLGDVIIMSHIINENSRYIPSQYNELLEKADERTNSSNTQIAFYFQDRDSNPLKNVLVAKIIDGVTTYHKHDFFEINYCLSGTLYQRIAGNNFAVREGELIFMSPGVYHACCPAEDAASYNILFKKEWLEGVASSFEKYDPSNYLTSLVKNEVYTTFSFGKSSDECGELVKKLINQAIIINRHVDMYENLVLENYAFDFLLYLTKHLHHEFNYVSGKNLHAENYTPDEIVKYINDNFSKITLEDAANHFGYSRSQLHRILKTHTGHVFSELILSMRMMRARHYLLNTTLPIKSIANLLGLDSAEHFARMFKKHRNMTPKQYRDSYMRQSIKKKKKVK